MQLPSSLHRPPVKSLDVIYTELNGSLYLAEPILLEEHTSYFDPEEKQLLKNKDYTFH